jgi:hypothetical protein
MQIRYATATTQPPGIYRIPLYLLLFILTLHALERLSLHIHLEIPFALQAQHCQRLQHIALASLFV